MISSSNIIQNILSNKECLQNAFSCIVIKALKYLLKKLQLLPVSNIVSVHVPDMINLSCNGP